ncbi:MAG: hypothetical protein NUW08_01730 [Candidatus Uhrbacteria bacterium]|nr:hypothetical protein [Candidatus Uhrbacteria bacterium]
MKEKFERRIGETAQEKAFFGEQQERADVSRLAREESSLVESATERLKQEIQGASRKEAPSLPWLADFHDAAISPEGQILLTQEEYVQLNQETDAFFEEVRYSNTATAIGFDVAAAYDAHVKGWTTRSKIIEINGKKLFALCNYPSSRARRLFDRSMEAVSGDPMRKPKPEQWKKIVESRSTVPTVAGTPEDMVVMPYIESINAYDIFANQKEIKDFGPFDWAKDMDVETKIALSKELAETLKTVHESGKTWGESILPNFILTKEKIPILIDAETTYEDIPTGEQKATDVRNLMSSISGALARSAGITDFSPIIREVLAGYPDPEVLAELERICSKPQPWRQRMIFSFFSRFRLGATSLEEFERVKKAIVEILNQE